MKLDINDILDSLAADQSLVFAFFGLFSRFEFALKRSGFLLGDDKSVSANWDAFANSLRGKLDGIQDASYREASALLLSRPPRRQVVDGTDIKWSDSQRGSGEHIENYLLRLIRTVRNNLFHGGKYPYEPVTDVGRDDALLKASMVVLTHCLRLSPSVTAAFEELP